MFCSCLMNQFAKEVPRVRQIVANDLSSQAVEFIKRNIQSNDVENLVLPVNKEATSFMYEHRALKERFDVVDLDPYGSAAKFLDAAVQCVCDDGLLMVTCTDVAVLCGNTPETCYAKYGSMSLKSKCCHEIAIRILISSIDSRANCYGRFVEPLLSVSVDFYVRVFLLIKTGPSMAKRSKSLIYQCGSCESFVLQSLARQVATSGGSKFTNALGPPVQKTCKYCGGNFRVSLIKLIAGPIWSAPIHDMQFVERVLGQVESMKGTDMQLGTTARLIGVLKVVREYIASSYAKAKFFMVSLFYYYCIITSVAVRSAILNGNYRVSASHACPSAVKTDAPNDFIWNIMQAWAKLCLPSSKLSKLDERSPAYRILSLPMKNEINFNEHPLCEPTSKAEGCLRYQMNPEKNWGPRSKAKIKHGAS
ncbi:TRM1 tRNA methyltransferase 1 [Trichuris trichiura]|uniref:tRNA (guanine(26)-N(2))-dimethyltransferase n=1 Tax=Trichuris trichiura TaxID=36087 RepID=A0A077Z5Y0_TRITR|nr:TRM1 tRNA methyltransferase 1 [Trichuris trichiura]